MYKTRFFELDELVPKRTYEYVDHWILWQIFDEGLLRTADYLRDEFGRCWVNNWKWGGDIEMAGYRPPDSITGAKYSMHKFARALDLKFIDTDTNEVRQEILDNPGEFPFITRVECKVDWLHIDTANTGSDMIKVFMP